MYLFQPKVFHIVNADSQERFLADPGFFSVILDPPHDIDQQVDFNRSTSRDHLDEHAPLRTKEIARRPLFPSYSKDIQAAKK